jgi:putative oxidoreductase
MRYLALADSQRNLLLLIARIFLTALFIVFGGQKVMDFQGTVNYMTATGAPIPELSAVVAIVAELIFGLALLLGFFTRPLALLLAVYTLGTAFIGHHFWTMTGAEQYENMINFYKNVSIFGGLFALAVAGPGRFSLDGR